MLRKAISGQDIATALRTHCTYSHLHKFTPTRLVSVQEAALSGLREFFKNNREGRGNEVQWEDMLRWAGSEGVGGHDRGTLYVRIKLSENM